MTIYDTYTYIYIHTYSMTIYDTYTYIYIYVSIHVPSSHVITSSQEVSTIPITRLCFNLSLHPTTRSALLGHFLILLCDRAERVDSVTTDGPLANMTPFK